MTAKEYADELVEEYMKLFSVELENSIALNEAAKCAAIVCDKMIDSGNEHFYIVEIKDVSFLREVKFELLKL